MSRDTNRESEEMTSQKHRLNFGVRREIAFSKLNASLSDRAEGTKFGGLLISRLLFHRQNHAS